MGLGKLQWGPLKSFSIIDCIFHMQYSRIILLQHSTVQDKVQYSTVYIYSMFQIYSTIQYPEWKPRNPFQFNLGIVGDENGCCLQRTKIALQFWPKHASLAWIFHVSQDHLLHSPFFYLVHFGLPFTNDREEVFTCWTVTVCCLLCFLQRYCWNNEVCLQEPLLGSLL